jgi:predicted esterase
MTTNHEFDEHHIETLISGRVLVRRPRHGSAAGVLLGYHGYAESAEIQLDRLSTIPATDDWILASVQGLNRFYRGRSEDTVASWMTRQDRELAIAANVSYVDRILDRIRNEYDIGADTLNASGSLAIPLVHAGFSQGGAMAFRAGVRSRWRADGIICVGADVPPELLAGPAAQFPAVLLARGERDEWYTRPKFEADVSALGARSVPLTPIVFAGAHEWTGQVASHAAAFIGAVSSAFKHGR